MSDNLMKQDGTKYLCYIEFPEMYVPGEFHDGGAEYHKESGHTDWMVLHWGYPCGLSMTVCDKKQWIVYNGFVPKIKNILSFQELINITME